jgi:predicted nucleic acid-binding Zn ribbon protein
MPFLSTLCFASFHFPCHANRNFFTTISPALDAPKALCNSSCNSLFEKSSRRQQTHALDVVVVRELVVVIFVVFMGVSFSEVQSVF